MSESNQVNSSQSGQLNPIVKITIENFQSHEKTILKPAGAGQLTVIVGQSRQGKTAIFRALRWLFYNAPDGTDFIRWGAIFARVTAEYMDGTQVIRHRTSGGVNRYIVRKMDAQGQLQEQVYEGFGRGMVPLEVQQVTGVSPVEIGEGLSLSLNLAEQLDGPFLGNKSVSSTARAKVLGKLAGTEEVDLAGKQLGTDLFRWKRDQEAHEKVIKDTEGQLQGYDYLPGFKANLDRLAGIRDTVKAAIERRDQIDGLYREYNQVNFRANDERLKMLRCRDLIEKLTPTVEAIEGQIRKAGGMSQARTDWAQNTALLGVAQATINSTQGLLQAEDILKGAEGRFGRRQQAETIAARWNKVVWDMEQSEKVIRNTERVLAAEALVGQAQKDLAQIDRLFSIYYQFGVVKGGLCKAESVLYETNGVPQADSWLAELHSSVDKKNRLAALSGKWEQSKEDMAVVERQMERTKGIDSAEGLSTTIGKNIVRNKWLDNFVWNFDSFDKQIKKESIMAKSAGEEVERLQEDYAEVLGRAGKCPLCNSDINKSKVKEIL